MWYSENYGLIRSPKAITVNDIQHPANIFTVWSKAELANIGFYPAKISVPDSRYYNSGAAQYSFDSGSSEWIVSYGSSEKMAGNLKSSMKSAVKSIASSALSKSDWMQHREAEGGTAMSANWKTYRASVRAESNEKEGEIDALLDLDAIKAYDAAGGVTAGWPNDPDYVAE